MSLRYLLLFALAVLALAQSFEVASIKPNAAGDNRAMMRMEPGGRFTASGATVRMLVGIAFDVRDFQVLNAPGWSAAERFDIQAKAPDSMGDRVPMDQVRRMLRALLAERCQLQTHSETRELPIYSLLLAKGGSKLKPVEAPQGRPQMMRVGRGQFHAEGVPLDALAQMLSGQVGRTVLDRTGLKGTFAVDLEWTPETSAAAEPAAGADGPGIFTALEEQLGLKLESSRGPVQMVVVDRLERPSEN
jgi:uncharacterized protein (TIGR03435 family)